MQDEMLLRRRHDRNPLVSIGMPVYNGARYIREALESVILQGFQNYELIISDNASEDATGTICAEYSGKHPQIRYIRQPHNIGGHGNFNFVTQQARGDFITWLAHDDALEADFLHKTVAYLLVNSRAAVIATDFAVIDEHGAQIGLEQLASIRPEISWSRRAPEFFEYPGSNVFFCIYGLMRTDVCKGVLRSLAAPRRASGSELPILARMAVHGEIAALPHVLRKYRRHAASVYVTEEAELARASMVRRHAIRAVNVYRLRFDQLQVLWCSSLPPGFKCTTSFRVIGFYCALLLLRMQKVMLLALSHLRPR
jgi:glycosyltransferase involved in cell wall biosynthesis